MGFQEQHEHDREQHEHDDDTGRILRAIHILDRKVDKLMASVEEVTAALTGLKADMEGLANDAKAEFAKLEAEVAAGQPPNLDPLKEAIDALDAQVKGAVVPTA